MKSKLQDWLKVLLLLMDEVVAVVVVLLILWYFRISIPLWAGIVLALFLGACAFIIHKAVIPTFHLKRITGPEAMVGLEGEVVEPLTPNGIVRVGAEYWQARSAGDEVSVGEQVEVLGLNKLVLEVKRKEQSSGG